ncbi:hypothetical protein QYM36_019644 [Artemia franciscana]|uniref:Protein ROP n=1 Tax=Artemia franciscana TaxID=6661 RepID=A0AA88KZ65_ARTSF|nr:hypothetical protein QYM36_019644 [Artemia franciscana]
MTLKNLVGQKVINEILKITDFLFRRKRKERRTQYKAAHVYFTKACPKELSKELYKHISGKYIRTMKYINIAFIPCESQVFSLDFPDGFQCYYNQNRISQRAAALERMAEQIATLCATLGVYPAVRYRADNERNIEFAQIIQHKLNRYKADDPTMGDGPEKSRSQLLVIDRGVDGVSPLLHELTFQAMAYDLLPSENDVNKFLLTSQYKSGVEKKVLVDENDDRWKELRHQHIEIVFKNISKNLKTYVTYENNLKKSLTAGDNRLCKVEQDLAMGVDAEGNEVKNNMRLMHPLLAEENVSPMDKIRIILLYILSKNGISGDFLTKLIKHAAIPNSERTIITSLTSLGFCVINEEGGGKQWCPNRKKRKYTYQMSRWTPIIKDVMEDAIDNKLDEEHFPYLAGAPASTGARGITINTRNGQWHKDRSQQNMKDVLRLIVFIVGGATFSEIRCAYEVTKAKEFLKNLKQLSE